MSRLRAGRLPAGDCLPVTTALDYPTGVMLRGRLVSFTFASWLVLQVLFAPAASAADTLGALAGRVPRELEGLRADGEDGRYDSKTIFSYLDGGAEVYLAYRMRGCWAREYAAADLVATLDVFEMGSPADAFGMFSEDPDGDAVAIGQGSRLKPGWLSFWKGRFFVSVTVDKRGERGRAALLTIGRAAASAIDEDGSPSDLLAHLPQESLVPRSARFLRSPVLLSPHINLGEGNPLRLGGTVEVVLGRYARDGERAVALLVRYPTPSDAARAVTSVRARLGASKGAAAPRWRATIFGRVLALVVQESGSGLIDPLLMQVANLVARGATGTEAGR